MSCPLSTRCSTNVILLRSLLGELMNWSWLESKHAGPSCVVPDVESPLTLVPWLVAIVLPKRHIMFLIKHETSQMVSRYWGSNPLKLQLTLAYIHSGNRCCTSLNCTNGHAEFVEKWQDSARKMVVIALPEPSPHKLWWSGSPPRCSRVAVPLRCLVCWHRLAQQRGPKHWWRGENILPTTTKPGLELKILGVQSFEWTRTCGNLTAQSMFNRWLVLQRGLVWIYIGDQSGPSNAP